LKNIPVKQQRKINLNQKEIDYTLRFSNKAKYLRLQINNANELEVILPERYKHEKAEDFILQKKEWVLKHLKEKQSNSFHFFGKEIKVLLHYDLFVKKPQIIYSNKKLIANIPSGYSFTQDEIYNFWLRHKAKIYIPKRVRELSKLTGFNYSKITIRSQKTRWGSCSANGRLAFNYKLIKFREKVVNYVIIHELCHLKELNHSKKFWKLVERFCPDYKNLKRELKS
jgi:predicted metal-dependent hydrolase